MKKYIILAMAICLAAACGRTVTPTKHDADKLSFDAWVTVQMQKHPKPEYLWQQTRLGSWILEDTPGTGDLIDTSQDSLYVRLNYTSRSTNGTINSTTYARIAQQLGTYNETYYYGPDIIYVPGSFAGLEDILEGMRDGGRRKAAVPGWLHTYSRYDSPEKYLNDSTSRSAVIYDIEVVEHFRNTDKWELDSIARYLVRQFPSRFGKDAGKARADSAGTHGFYYIQTEAPTGDKALTDTTVYINYTGRRLDGSVFDTTVRDTAIFYGLYSKSKTYGPVSVKYGTKWSDIKLDSNSVIEGFARTLSCMKENEKGTGIFYSPIGYAYKGSGSAIPAYSPLRFDIELVQKQ